MQLRTTEEIIDYLDRSIKLWDDEIHSSESAEGFKIAQIIVDLIQTIREFSCGDRLIQKSKV